MSKADGISNSTSAPVLTVVGATASSGGSMLLPDGSVVALVPKTFREHNPKRNEDCAEFEQVVDFQLQGLSEALQEPCPHCGKKRDEEES